MRTSTHVKVFTALVFQVAAKGTAIHVKQPDVESFPEQRNESMACSNRQLDSPRNQCQPANAEGRDNSKQASEKGDDVMEEADAENVSGFQTGMRLANVEK